ncbi:MAG: transglutaminase domain-containing protein [bacterium]
MNNLTKSLCRYPIVKLSVGVMLGLHLWLVSVGTTAGAGFSTIPSSAGALASERTVEFTYRTTVELPDTGSATAVHIPMPQGTPWQEILSVSLSRNPKPDIYYDQTYGNKILRYEFESPDGEIITLKQVYRVKRTNRVGSLEADVPDSPVLNGTYYSRYLTHHQYMQTNEKIKQIAGGLRKSSLHYSDRLRSVFDRVRGMMTYDKSGRGWGKGDIRYCLKVGKGNCTDFHTLFASIARELRIPSRFVMGFPIPRNRSRGTIGGYHCWVESYRPGDGWFPMDISEADRHPDLVDFYFGQLDADRLQFTRGKNIPLSNGERVNYLIYPKITGNKATSVKTRFHFRNL